MLYTTIPHFKLKDRLRELVQLCFISNIGDCELSGYNMESLFVAEPCIFGNVFEECYAFHIKDLFCKYQK